MAIWQYDLIAIPRQSLLVIFNRSPKQIPPDEFDNYDWWTGRNAPDEQEFQSLLPSSSSWSASIKAWGLADDGHRLEMHYCNGLLYELKIRIDLRAWDRHLFDSVLQLAAHHDFVFWTEDGFILEPVASDILQDIARSRAFSFVRDPSEFLNRLS